MSSHQVPPHLLKKVVVVQCANETDYLSIFVQNITNDNELVFPFMAKLSNVIGAEMPVTNKSAKQTASNKGFRSRTDWAEHNVKTRLALPKTPNITTRPYKKAINIKVSDDTLLRSVVTSYGLTKVSLCQAIYSHGRLEASAIDVVVNSAPLSLLVVISNDKGDANARSGSSVGF
uniref:Uncharacterized protein n=1 Tax=Glossina palpalis gambiensis TaxID=67801 RepID=A0A1B0BQ24_9MUSC